jgi:hypothetical protein
MGHQNNPYEKKPKHNSVGTNNPKNIIGPINPANSSTNPKKIINEIHSQENVKNLKKYESLMGKKK